VVARLPLAYCGGAQSPINMLEVTARPPLSFNKDGHTNALIFLFFLICFK
jgi:hypothetical protein